jgi:hypothetical protein
MGWRSIGFSALTCAPMSARNHVQLCVIGGAGPGDRFTLAWPIWGAPASFAAVRAALLSHPKLHEPQALDHLGVDHVRVPRRINLDRLRNFTNAEPLAERGWVTAPEYIRGVTWKSVQDLFHGVFDGADRIGGGAGATVLIAQPDGCSVVDRPRCQPLIAISPQG